MWPEAAGHYIRAIISAVDPKQPAKVQSRKSLKPEFLGFVIATAALFASCADGESSSAHSADSQFAAFKAYYLHKDDGDLGDPTTDAGLDALRGLEQAAYAGHPEAQLHLGHMLTSGLILPPNPEKGLYWLLLSAQQGNLDAQLLVAGEFLMQAQQHEDPEEAKIYEANSLRWYKIAGENGSAAGRRMYAQGLVEQVATRSEGIQLLGDLAAAGDVSALETLQLLHDTTKDVEQMLIAGELAYEKSLEEDLYDVRVHALEIEEQLRRVRK